MTTTDAPPRWTPSETLAEARRLKGTAFKALFHLRHAATAPADAADVQAALRCSRKSAYNALHELETAGLARCVGGHPARYKPT